jgi:serine/threonine protein phosphatase PrpC
MNCNSLIESDLQNAADSPCTAEPRRAWRFCIMTNCVSCILGLKFVLHSTIYDLPTQLVFLIHCTNSDISNAGDSRAVLARRSTTASKDKTSNNKKDAPPANENSDATTSITQKSTTPNLTAIPLSIDQNPDSPGEKERILSSGGFVSPPPEPGLSARVWLDAANTQIGLAMARSIGDHAVKDVGVIAEPVVTVHEISEEDEFVILASDGVWEFLDNEDAVRIVSECLYDSDEDAEVCASAACEALIKAAMEKWHESEGDYRDDITAIVVRLKDMWRLH